jgi:hypothetical protein
MYKGKAPFESRLATGLWDAMQQKLRVIHLLELVISHVGYEWYHASMVGKNMMSFESLLFDR